MSKKTSDSLNTAIKEMEQKAREEAKTANPQPLPEVVFFDQWWATKYKQIPAMHRKEVILADFKGRGLTNKETPQEFDLALKKYGIDIA